MNKAPTVDVTFRVRTRAARYWISVMRVLQYVVGFERALAWADWGARRLVKVDRIRIGAPK